VQIIWSTLAPTETAVPLRQGDAELINDILWAHAHRSIGLEHVTVISERDGICLAFFLRQDTVNAISQVQSLLNELQGRLPGNRGGTVTTETGRTPRFPER
jgi:hypothetical protein